MQSREYIFKQTKMAKTAMAFGIAAIVFALIYMPYFSIPLGCFALLFAVLSKGNSFSFSREGKIALLTGVAGIAIAVMIFAKVYNALATDADYRKNIAEYAEMLYGDTYEELYGESIADMMEEMFSGRSK